MLHEATTNFLYSALTAELNSVATELEESAEREGFPTVILTGKMHIDRHTSRLWFEVLDDEVGILSWVAVGELHNERSAALNGEKLIGAASLEEALQHP